MPPAWKVPRALSRALCLRAREKRAFWKYAKPATRTTFALIAAFQLLLLLTSGIRDIMNTDFFSDNNILYVNIIEQISIHRFLLASINIFVLIIS